MKRVILSSILTALVLTVSACSFLSPQSGEVDEMPNFIKGTVNDLDNTPVENARVVLTNIRFTQHGIEVVEEKVTQSDEQGNFKILAPDNRKFTLFAEHEGSSHIIGRLELIGDSLVLNPINITPFATLSGRVLGADNVSVSIAGLDYSTTTNIRGEYILQNVPAGEFDIVFSSAEFVNILHVEVLPLNFSDTIYLKDVELNSNVAGGYTFFEASEIEVSLIDGVTYNKDNLPPWYSGKDFKNVNYLREDNLSGNITKRDHLGRPFVLIDDFDYHTLVPLIDIRRGGDQSGVGWFFFANSPGDSTQGSYFLPEGVMDDKSKAIDTQQAYRSQSFHVEMNLSADNNLPFAGFGVPFNGSYNMSDLEEITFYAKGEGELLLSIWTKLVHDYPREENWGHFSYPFELTQDWQLYTLNIEDFTPRPGSPQRADSLFWDDAKDRVTGFEFISAPEGDYYVDIWLDEIKFIGTEFIQNNE